MIKVIMDQYVLKLETHGFALSLILKKHLSLLAKLLLTLVYEIFFTFLLGTNGNFDAV